MVSRIEKIIKKPLTPENILFWGEKCIPAILDILFMCITYINFSLEYLTGYKNIFVSINSPYLSSLLFVADFYFFSSVYIIFLMILIFKRNFRYQIFSLIFSITTAVLLDYTMGDLLTIKMFVFISWILTVAVSIDLPYSLVLIIAGSAIFIIFQYHPAVLGAVDNLSQTTEPDKQLIFAFVTYLIAAAVIFITYKIAIRKWAENVSISQHLNMVMTQMSQFNQKLQDAAKNRGDEAAKQERMRITRDMHDSCGYVFVNIVALMDASESNGPKGWKETEEIYKTVRDLASKSLQDTRKTLHALREIESPLGTTLDTLYEIKQLFHTVTGIKVNLDTGNLKHNYGRSINAVITPIMQEALTNAVRHGRATEIAIYLWDDEENLTMIVKDNGVGSKQVIKGIGLAGMEERLEKIGGFLETASSIEGGFRLTITIPLTGQENGNE